MQSFRRLQVDSRAGVTLVEVVIAVAIALILIGLMLPAIQAVRTAALRSDVSNRLRQIALAAQHHETAQVKKHHLPPTHRANGGGHVFWVLSPYVSGRANDELTGYEVAQHYRSPADPSHTFYPDAASNGRTGNCSFAVNSLASTNRLVFDDIPDGQSNTVGFSERYARCAKQDVIWSLSASSCAMNGVPVPCPTNVSRRATFADSAYVDLIPTKSGFGFAYPDESFQVRPAPDQCDGRVVQGAFASGLQVAYIDGSVRTVAGSVDPRMFWSLITPDGGESTDGL
jgi:type II secretory pathway pseudopilin PulG